MAGDFRFIMKSGHFLCGSFENKIQSIPLVADIAGIESTAKFVLIVEKEAIFQRLLDGNIKDKLNSCIVITGKGYPDMSTRLMIRFLWDALKLPTFVLTDADPYGLEIFCVYKYGSKEMSFEAENLCFPLIKWLGVLPSEFNKYTNDKIPISKTIFHTWRNK
ncbi:uncharacterized protein TRIADDRAFT_57943 [Trichoplax adhaerens]|uniref:Topoisomerase 6 subunit A/Spo11 TOPRIM domain-containing protein n=1 Tax=Trichoplax adhaerens TaxID=10228 RepID=B3S267_TRIAD|nr:hypothetical protein TRIADDRAFT_57943 [Trichoplax adhaerens]EDV23061.1 hypothetical protein TRIADDRAFT_57943 [Trichoplax adhaerens]|eukprot:XP_002113971.1 hypothetical protein TRIADDRAFT_57943 [Trichoplax adhaerens]